MILPCLQVGLADRCLVSLSQLLGQKMCCLSFSGLRQTSSLVTTDAVVNLQACLSWL